MRLLKGEELTTIYPQLFKQVFGYEPDKQIPKMVMVDDKCEGFVSGYLIDKENFYMSWAGHISGFKGVRRCFNEMEAKMVSVGVKYFQAAVENTNTVAQRLMMGMGWIPFGMKVTQGKIFIEYYKELKDVDLRSA